SSPAMTFIASGHTLQNRPSTASAVRRDARIGKPQPGGRLAGLVKYVDRDAAARVPIAADPQPYRGQALDQLARDRQGAVLVKGAVVAKRAEIELQRLALEDHRLGHIIDDEVGEVRLTGHRAQRGEFGAGEAHG